jgi:hypothetical protein
MPTDVSNEGENAEEKEDLGLGEYPSSNKIPDSFLDQEVEGSVPDHRERPSEAEVIQRLRELGVAVVRAKYEGGHDEAFYTLIELFDEEGVPMTGQEDVSSFLDRLGWHNGPEVTAVDRAHGGYFSGSGWRGRRYGGTVEMRLDTLETREVTTFAEVVKREDHEDAEWGSGPTADP